MNTHLPLEHFNAECRKVGRAFDQGTEFLQQWRGDEFGLFVLWPDGFNAWIGFGPVATAVIDARLEKKH